MPDTPTVEIKLDAHALDRVTTESSIRLAIIQHITELLDVHWSRIVDIRDQEESKVTLGLNVNVNAQGKRPVVKTKIRYAKTFTDECEEAISDQSQGEQAA